MGCLHHLLWLLLFTSSAHSFYILGLGPDDYRTGDELYVRPNPLSSTKTHLPLAYDYLRYCKKLKYRRSFLGVARGERVDNPIYMFRMREEQPCTVACKQTLNAEEADAFKSVIDDEYRVNMVLDSLPVAVQRRRLDGSSPKTYDLGFSVGFMGNYNGSKEVKHFINNHLSFKVLYHRVPGTDSAKIVGFEVSPTSINHEYKEWPKVATCNQLNKTFIQRGADPQEVITGTDIVFSYDVSYEESDTKWASRLNTYLPMNNDQTHWCSVIYSLVLVILLAEMICVMMLKNAENSNELEAQEIGREVAVWKRVQADVFREPVGSDFLCCHLGIGFQLLGTSLTMMIFGSLGFFSTSDLEGFMSFAALVCASMGLIAGYSATRLYKMFKVSDRALSLCITITAWKSPLGFVFFGVGFIYMLDESSGVVPLVVVGIVIIWWAISLPLVYLGGYLAGKAADIELPVKPSKLPRGISEQPWHMNPIFNALVGIFPFCSIYPAWSLIMSSILQKQLPYFFSLVVLVIVLILCAEFSVILCYFQLRREDYNWWWRAYLIPACSGCYLLVFSIFFYFNQLETPVSAVAYFGCAITGSCLFGVLAGTVGFYAAFFFVWRIYSSEKIN